MSKNLLNDRRFLESFDSERGGKQKSQRPVKREMTDSKAKQRDKTRRMPKEY